MSVIPPGREFIDFTIAGFDTASIRARKPLLIVFWHTTCSTCATAMPYFQRIADRIPGVQVLGICQELSVITKPHCQEQGIKFPQISDRDHGMAASRLYGPTVVPTYYLTDGSGIILASGTGWDVARIEEIFERACALTGVQTGPLITADDGVPAYKPG